MAKQHLPRGRRVSIVDLGCGHGAFLFVLRELGFQKVRGVDVSGEQVEAARRLGVKGIEYGDALSYARTRATGSVDVHLTMDLLDHLLELTDQVHRLLGPGGRWLIHVPNAEGLFGPGVRYGDLTDRRAVSAASAGLPFIPTLPSSTARLAPADVFCGL